MSQKISKRLIAMALCFAFCVQMVAGLSFANDKDTTSYKVKVSVIDPEGNKLDMSKVDFMFQMGDSERYGAYSTNESEGGRFIKWTPFVKWTNEYVSTEHARKGDFKYSISADKDDYMFQLNGTVPFNTLEKETKNGQEVYEIVLDLREIKPVEVTAEIPGSHFEKYTVAFLPKNHIYNTNFGMTNGVVGTFDPKEASKTVYLSEADYTPVFTFEDASRLVVLSDDTFKMDKRTKDTYNYVGKTTRCVNTNIKTESEQSSTLYYSTHFYGAEGIYSHFGYWQKEKLSVLLDKNVFNSSYMFCLSEKNYDFYKMAQRYDVKGDLNLSDQFYIASFESLEHNALSSEFTFNFKDLNGNAHDRVLFEGDNITFSSSDDIAKDMKLQKNGHIYTLVYPTNMDFSKTYKVQFFNAAEGSSMGASIFELSFLNKEPKFKFIKVDKQTKVSSFSFDAIKDEKLLVTFNFVNKFKTKQDYKVCLMDGSATKSVLESFNLMPNEKMTQTFEIPVADLIMNPKLTIRLNSGRRVLDNMDLANAFGNDIKTHWASKAIISLLSRQVAFYPETKNQMGLNLSDTMAFEPNTPITRGEFASYMTRFAKLDLGVDLKAIADEKNLEVSLSDVPSNHQYATEIMMVAKAGLINGSNGKFNPNQTISRQDAAAIFKRVMVFASKEDKPQSSNELSRIVAKYADAKHISKYAVDGVNFCVANKIMSGNQSNRMLPKASISRGEVCTILEFMSKLNLEKLDW